MMANRFTVGLVLLLAGAALGQLRAQGTVAERKHFEETKAKAEKGDAEAQLELGDLYLKGDGVSQDPKRAARWHRKAAEQGLARGAFQFGLDCSNGFGVKANKEEAASWIHRAADQGLAEAQLACGYIYSRGEGVRPDAVEAMKYFRQAAEQKLPMAIHEVGRAYFEGNGVVKDIVEGLKWTQKAADLGCAPAQDRLGLCYMKGEGLAKDYLQAYKWFNLAASHGDDQTYDYRVDLAKVETLLSAEQIAEAQRLAREFKPRSSDSPANSTTEDGHSQRGLVQVTAADETCDILVDGAFAGNPPATLKLSEGSHVIEVKKAGFKNFRKEISVTGGSQLTLRAVLEKQ